MASPFLAEKFLDFLKPSPAAPPHRPPPHQIELYCADWPKKAVLEMSDSCHRSSLLGKSCHHGNGVSQLPNRAAYPYVTYMLPFAVHCRVAMAFANLVESWQARTQEGKLFLVFKLVHSQFLRSLLDEYPASK